MERLLSHGPGPLPRATPVSSRPHSPSAGGTPTLQIRKRRGEELGPKPTCLPASEAKAEGHSPGRAPATVTRRPSEVGCRDDVLSTVPGGNQPWGSGLWTHGWRRRQVPEPRASLHPRCAAGEGRPGYQPATVWGCLPSFLCPPTPGGDEGWGLPRGTVPTHGTAQGLSLPEGPHWVLPLQEYCPSWLSPDASSLLPWPQKCPGLSQPSDQWADPSVPALRSRRPTHLHTEAHGPSLG